MTKHIDFNDAVAYSLKAGILLSAALVLFGAFLVFYYNGASGLSLSQLSASNSQVNTHTYSISEIFSGIANLNGISFILLGLIVLITTPVFRVLISVLAFLREGNRLFFAITLIVLIDLLVAIFIVPHFVAG